MDANDPRRRDVLKGVGVAGAVGLAGLAGCSSGGGDDYPSQDITWIVPYSAGGGYDAYSRAFAQFMPDRLSNSPNIVVENHPGAGARTGANIVWRADADGYTVGIMDLLGLSAYQAVLGDPEYDISEYTWLGIIAQEPYTFWAKKGSDLKTVDDLKNADQVSFTGEGPGSASYDAAVVATNEMEINAKFVTGYDGTTEQMNAVIRGDADVATVNSSSARQLYEDGELQPIVAFNDDGLDYASEAQAAGKLGYSGSVAVGRLTRGFATSPDVSDDIASTLEDAFVETGNSDDMKQWSEENKRPLAIQGADAASQAASDALDTFKQFADLFE